MAESTFDRVLFSSKRDDWETPPDLFAALNREFQFCWDVAANRANTKVAGCFFGPGSGHDEDALVTQWGPFIGPCWCNPPYSRGLQGKFIAKAARERLLGCTIVMLLPARTDTKAFHDHIWNEFAHMPRNGVTVRFLRGRLTFVGAPSSAPFPSMIVVFRGMSTQTDRPR